MAEKDKKPEIRFTGFTDAWEQRKVGDYYYFKNGLNKGKEFFGHGVPIVNFTDVFHNRGINASILKGKVDLQPSEIANYRVQKGDIFFTRTSETIDEIGYPSVMLDEPKDTVFSGFVLRGRAIDEDPLTLKFKRYVFYTDKFRKEMIKKSSMTTRALTSGTAIRQMEFHFPKDKREQDKIGDHFQELDLLITLHQRKYDKLVIVKKTMLEKMFPKDGANVPEIRFAGFTDTWKQRKLGEIADRVQGNDGRMDMPTLTISAANGWLDQRDRFYGNIAGNEQKNYTLLLKGELSYNHGNSKLAKYGVVFELRNYEEALVPRIYHSFRVKEDTVSSFVEYLFSTKLPDKELGKLISSGARMDGLLNISYDDFMGIAVNTPQKAEQAKIGAFFRKLDHLITLHQRELEKLKNIKKSLLEKMFV